MPNKGQVSAVVTEHCLDMEEQVTSQILDIECNTDRSEVCNLRRIILPGIGYSGLGQSEEARHAMGPTQGGGGSRGVRTSLKTVGAAKKFSIFGEAFRIGADEENGDMDVYNHGDMGQYDFSLDLSGEERRERREAKGSRWSDKAGKDRGHDKGQILDTECNTDRSEVCNLSRIILPGCTERGEPQEMSGDCSSLGSEERLDPRVLPIQKVIAPFEMEKEVEDLELTLDMDMQKEDMISRPPRTSTPIREYPSDDITGLEMNFSSIVFKEHSYHAMYEDKLLKNRGFPLCSLMKNNWSESRVSKSVSRKISSKSKKIVKPQSKRVRKFFTKEDLSVATHILYSSRRVYKMLRNQKLLDLPCERTVYKHLQRFKCRPGINNEMKKLLTLFLSSLDPADRICGVLYDEVKLSQQMSWSPRLKTVFKPYKVQIIIFSIHNLIFSI